MAAAPATWDSVIADLAPAAAPPEPRAAPTLRGPTVLRRGLSALPPSAHAKRKEKAPRAPIDNHDPRHPLRGNGQCKRVYAPRPARLKGSSAWLELQTDSYQNRTRGRSEGGGPAGGGDQGRRGW